MKAPHSLVGGPSSGADSECLPSSRPAALSFASSSRTEFRSEPLSPAPVRPRQMVRKATCISSLGVSSTKTRFSRR